MISGQVTWIPAVNTMRLGAFDYISKPPDLNRLLNTVRMRWTARFGFQKTHLKKKVSKDYEMVGESELVVIIKIL
jgi:DNA-binding NtrC family response regulator